MLDDRTVKIIAIVVLVIWASLNVADAALSAYEMPSAIHGIMGLVAGGAFGRQIVRRSVTGRDERVKELLDE